MTLRCAKAPSKRYSSYDRGRAQGASCSTGRLSHATPALLRRPHWFAWHFSAKECRRETCGPATHLELRPAAPARPPREWSRCASLHPLPTGPAPSTSRAHGRSLIAVTRVCPTPGNRITLLAASACSPSPEVGSKIWSKSKFGDGACGAETLLGFASSSSASSDRGSKRLQSRTGWDSTESKTLHSTPDFLPSSPGCHRNPLALCRLLSGLSARPSSASVPHVHTYGDIRPRQRHSRSKGKSPFPLPLPFIQPSSCLGPHSVDPSDREASAHPHQLAGGWE